MITILLFIIASFFAMNIGASGAAAAMGIAYGSGAIKKRILALIICGIGIFLGAALGGGEVVKTLGSGIIPEQIITVKIALIIISSATLTLFLANITGIPLSTSEVTVGSVVGVGVAFHVLYVKNITVIVMYWLLIPFIAFLLSYLMNKVIKHIEKQAHFLKKGKWPKILAYSVIITGFLEAFSAGMNNVANSVGPLVGAGVITINQGTFLGGIFVALGAILLGSKVIETNGKKITDLNLLQGSAVSGIGATLVIISSLFGIPVPQTQVSTCSILGVGVSDKGKEIWKKAIIVRLIKTWALSPFVSLVLSYNFVKVFIKYDVTEVAGMCMMIAIAYMFTLRKRKIKATPLLDRKSSV